jgi:hypothetical protein
MFLMTQCQLLRLFNFNTICDNDTILNGSQAKCKNSERTCPSGSATASSCIDPGFNYRDVNVRFALDKVALA